MKEKIKETIQYHIDYLSRYTEVENMEKCDILHLYNTKKYWADNDWFYDAMMFDLWAYNTKTKQKIYLWEKDEIMPYDCGIQMIRIFVDGSTLVRFKELVKIWWGQSMNFYLDNK